MCRCGEDACSEAARDGTVCVGVAWRGVYYSYFFDSVCLGGEKKKKKKTTSTGKVPLFQPPPSASASLTAACVRATYSIEVLTGSSRLESVFFLLLFLSSVGQSPWRLHENHHLFTLFIK